MNSLYNYTVLFVFVADHSWSSVVISSTVVLSRTYGVSIFIDYCTALATQR